VMDLLLPKLLSADVKRCYLQLRDNEVEGELALQICRRLEQSDQPLVDELRQTLQALTAETIKFPSDKKQVFFVGPPGSGKSSALSKLAAQMVFARGRRVKLSTLDNFRPTAEAEIENLAEILGFVESNSDSAKTATSDELLLVDSEGLMPGDAENFQRLQQAIGQAESRFVILVLSALTSWRNNRSYLEHFAPLGIDAVMVTGLDLSLSFGTVLNVAAGQYPPLLGITDSRMPTGTIDSIDPEQFLEQLIGEIDV